MSLYVTLGRFLKLLQITIVEVNRLINILKSASHRRFDEISKCRINRNDISAFNKDIVH